MATKSVTKRGKHYHLDETTRLALIREASVNPSASIPPHLLAVVHRQRLRFIKKNGNDGGTLC